LGPWLDGAVLPDPFGVLHVGGSRWKPSFCQMGEGRTGQAAVHAFACHPREARDGGGRPAAALLLRAVAAYSTTHQQPMWRRSPNTVREGVEPLARVCSTRSATGLRRTTVAPG